MAVTAADIAAAFGGATYACPVGWCDVFPYDCEADLAEHLANHPTQSWQDRTPRPVRTEAPAPAPAAPGEVRGFGPGGTRTRVGTGGRKRTGAAPAASEAQLRFIAKLLAERPQLERPHNVATMTVPEASAFIDWLKLQPKPATAAPTKPEGLELVDGGVYATAEGTLVRVVRSGAGRQYGKVLDGAGRFTVYKAGVLRHLVRAITAEEAAEFGHLHHHCVFCGRNLRDEREGRSMEVGYGPVCANKYGLPWG